MAQKTNNEEEDIGSPYLLLSYEEGVDDMIFLIGISVDTTYRLFSVAIM
jgi:hypothetical protein